MIKIITLRVRTIKNEDMLTVTITIIIIIIIIIIIVINFCLCANLVTTFLVFTQQAKR